MKKIVFLVLLCVTFGCSKSNDPNATVNGVSWDQLDSAPRVDVPKEKLPEWMIVRINETEKRPVSISSVRIYKGEWNKQIVYFIMDTFSSCFCDFFTEIGARVDNDLLSDCRAISKNWILIYEYGELL